MLAYVGNGVGWSYYHVCIDNIVHTYLGDTSFTKLLFSISVVLLFSSSSTTSYNRSIPHFIELHFIVLLRYCSFYKLKICGKPKLSKSVGVVILTIYQIFHDYHILLWSVILLLQKRLICWGLRWSLVMFNNKKLIKDIILYIMLLNT